MEHKTPEHLKVSTEYLRRNLPEIMSKVEGGGARITVTSYGRPVAQFVPLPLSEDFAGLPEQDQDFAGLPEQDQPRGGRDA